MCMESLNQIIKKEKKPLIIPFIIRPAFPLCNHMNYGGNEWTQRPSEAGVGPAEGSVLEQAGERRREAACALNGVFCGGSDVTQVW